MAFPNITPVISLNDLDCELLEPYRQLRTRNWTHLSGIFIAEGPLLVERLLSSDYAVESILLDNKYAKSYLSLIPETVPVFLIEHDLVKQLVGFNFHRGVLGCGRRPHPKRLSSHPRSVQANETWLALVGVQDPENVGSMLRSAAGLGVGSVLIGPGTADPLSRRSLRVSMGNALRLEILYGSDIQQDIDRLKQMGMECIATTLSDRAESLENSGRTGPLVLFVGNEKYGLPEELVRQMDRSVSIPMSMNTDSLNVAVAAGIVMHYFSRLCPRQEFV